jgi:hypothetical protein
MQMHAHSHEADDEAFTRFLEADDEAQDDEGILDSIGNVAGKVLDPLGIFRGIAPSGSSGVRTARLNTPQGNASLRLPEPVVTERVFKESMTRLENALNQVRTQINNDRRVLQSTVRRQDAMLKATRVSIKRLESRRQQDQWMSMLTTMMLSQQSRRSLQAHTHGNAPGGDPVFGPSIPSDNSAMLMFLPMFMGDGMGGKSESSGGDNGMMMMLLMMTMMNR